MHMRTHTELRWSFPLLHRSHTSPGVKHCPQWLSSLSPPSPLPISLPSSLYFEIMLPWFLRLDEPRRIYPFFIYHGET